MDQNIKTSVVPMRFYANWEMDRASSSTISRTLSMKFTRILLTKPLTVDNALIISVKLQGYRRILRSNDINIISPLFLDYALDIAFTIQYCHFIKRKANILEIFIQRRKKYKNRQIPGVKTLAFGNINLDEIMQQGGSREVSIWDTASLKRLSIQDFHAGTIFISNCQSQAVETLYQDTNKWVKSNRKYLTVVSEEELDDYSSQKESDFEDFERRRHNDIKRSRKKIKQKNIKQKVLKLLKRFKVPEETSNVAGSTSSRVLPPTELELQEIFEELENISDSGPELEPDKMSIVSNPRPSLQPFFGSKTELLPAVSDRVPSDESVADSNDPDQESSEELPKESCYWVEKVPLELDFFFKATTSSQPFSLNMEQHCLQDNFKHSFTSNSISSTNDNQITNNLINTKGTPSVLSKRLADNLQFKKVMTDFDLSKIVSSVKPYNIWLTSSCDFSWICRVDTSKLENIFLFDCPTLVDVRTAICSIVRRIQIFCNSNSASPSTTRIGILGGDKLFSYVLQTYVDLLQNKSCSDWLHYLRFSVVLPFGSTIGRFITQLDGYLETIWRNNLLRLSTLFESGIPLQSDYIELETCLAGLTTESSSNQQKTFNFSIGEVMLQLESSSISDVRSKTKNNLQIFVPFISELYLGNTDKLNNSLMFFNLKNSFDDNSTQTVLEKPSLSSCITQNTFSTAGNLTPPISPHSHKVSDGRELNVEYWTNSANSTFGNTINSNQSDVFFSKFQPINQNLSLINTTHNKFSSKATVKNLCVTRELNTNSLSILLIKEKRKDKVLQKFGRKTKQKSFNNFQSQSRLISSVTRMVCSSNKNSLLDVAIDGIPWHRIRYFQISCQWQTHVKLFPISIPIF